MDMTKETTPASECQPAPEMPPVTEKPEAPLEVAKVLKMGPKFKDGDAEPSGRWVQDPKPVFATTLSADTRRFILEVVKDVYVLNSGEKERTRLSAHLAMVTGGDRTFVFKMPLGDVKRLAEWLPKQIEQVEAAAAPIVDVIMAERKLRQAQERAHARFLDVYDGKGQAADTKPVAKTGKTAKTKTKTKAKSKSSSSSSPEA